MPSGYEQSPDYGGPEPKPWVIIIGVLGFVGIAAAILLYAVSGL
jgi:hypothetical protein